VVYKRIGWHVKRVQLQSSAAYSVNGAAAKKHGAAGGEAFRQGLWGSSCI
jgi:hypothetical protein